MNTRLLAASVLLVASACNSFVSSPSDSIAPTCTFDTSDKISMSRRDVHARYDAAADELELVEVCFDVDGDARQLRELSEGARVYPATCPFIPLDVDAYVEAARVVVGGTTMPGFDVANAQRLLDVEPYIRVVETRAFLDEREHAGLVRRWKIGHFRDVVTFCDALLARNEEERGERPSLHQEWRDAGRPLVHVEGDRLVVDVPMSLPDATRALDRATHDDKLAELLRIAGEVQVIDGHMQITLRGTDNGWMRIVGRAEGHEREPITADDRAEGERQMGGWLSARDVAQRVGLAELPPARVER